MDHQSPEIEDRSFAEHVEGGRVAWIPFTSSIIQPGSGSPRHCLTRVSRRFWILTYLLVRVDLQILGYNNAIKKSEF